MNTRRQLIAILLLLQAASHNGNLNATEAAPLEDRPPITRNFDDLVISAQDFTDGHPMDLGILSGRAQWTTDTVAADRSQGSPPATVRSGRFVIDQVLHWSLDRGRLEPGSTIDFQVKRSSGPVIMGQRVGHDFDVEFSGGLATGENVPCLVMIRVRRHDPHRRELRQVFHFPNSDDDIIEDLRTAADIIVARPPPQDFDAWRAKVRGPLSTAVLLSAMVGGREPITSVHLPTFAIEVLEHGDARLRAHAMRLLTSTPDEILLQAPAPRLRDALALTAERLAGEVDDPNLLNQVEPLADIAARLPPDQSRQLAAAVHGHLTPAIDQWYAEQNQRRAARAAERAADPAEQRYRQIEARLGIRDPLADYTGPGQTPKEGRWIELRTRLEAMAK